VGGKEKQQGGKWLQDRVGVTKMDGQEEPKENVH